MSKKEPAKESSGLPCNELYGQILDDVHDMLDFVRAEGKTVPEELRTKVSVLCAEETERATPELTTTKTLETPPDKAVFKDGGRNISLALEIHGALSLLVTPATPRTIRASRSTGRWKFVADNITVKFLLLISIFSLVIFLSIALINVPVKEAEKAAISATNAPAASLSNATTAGQPLVQKAAGSDQTKLNAPVPYVPQTGEIFMLFAAASLGSAFYGLYTAHKYLVNCTFDPKYHQVYLIRYVLGLTSGTILGFFGRDFLKNDTDISKQLGVAVLALIGGYTAEAVSQILQRFSETLVTIVRGSNTDVLQAKQEELKAKAKLQDTQTKTELTKGLLKAKEEAIASNASPSVREEIQKAIDSLSK